MLGMPGPLAKQIVGGMGGNTKGTRVGGNLPFGLTPDKGGNDWGGDSAGTTVDWLRAQIEESADKSIQADFKDLIKSYDDLFKEQGNPFADAKKKADEAFKLMTENIGDAVKQWNDIVDSTRTAKEKAVIAARGFRANVEAQVMTGQLSQEAGMNQENEYVGDPIQVTAKHMQVQKAALDEYQKMAQHAAKSIQDAFASMFEHMGDGSQNFLQTILGVFKKILSEALALDLAKLLGLDKWGEKAGSGGSAVGGLISGVLSMFASGGSFTVGGQAGNGDSSLVMFRARAGERVSVGDGVNGGGGGSIQFAPVTNISAGPGTDMATLSAVISRNNLDQMERMKKLMLDNGFGRLR
jgi:ElaB/YqjD/DUF883 family membrane-anchored ribosome-binding protein